VRCFETIVVSLLLVAGMTAPSWAAQSATAQERTITVQGRGTIETLPDLATIVIGVASRGPNAATALDANSAAAQKVIDFAKRFGVANEDIRTNSVNLSENFKEARDTNNRIAREPDGYLANNSVTVRVRDLPRLGAFLRESLGAGANRISGVTFGLSNPEKLADEARAAAIDDAKRKATLLARAAGANVGPVVSIVYPPRVQYLDNAAELTTVRRAGGASVTVPVEIGQISVAVEVDVTWALE
jgi:uncharacterized protein